MNIRHHRRPGRHARPALTLDDDNGGDITEILPSLRDDVAVWYPAPAMETPPWYGDPSDPDPAQPDPDLEADPDWDDPPEGAEPLFEATVANLWPGLPGVRCTRDAAPHPTPIPCGAVFHDPSARTFPALYRSAYAAGWRVDALGRWHCHPCTQTSGQFWAAWPARVWDAGAAVDALGGVTRHGTYQEVTR